LGGRKLKKGAPVKHEAAKDETAGLYLVFSLTPWNTASTRENAGKDAPLNFEPLTRTAHG
jgi:hypothetical protein